MTLKEIEKQLELCYHPSTHPDERTAAIEALAEIHTALRFFEETKKPLVSLTIAELLAMEGEPIWIEELQTWAIVIIEHIWQVDLREYKAVPFARGGDFSYNIEARQLTCYKKKPMTQFQNKK